MKLLVTALGLAAVLAITPNGNAQTCIPFLTDIESYVTAGITNHEITMNMVSLATSKPTPPFPMHGQATYSEGTTVGWPAEMTYVPARMVGLYLFPATLQATTTTFYSDNHWASNTFTSQNPFSPLQTTLRTVVIFLGDYHSGTDSLRQRRCSYHGHRRLWECTATEL